MTNQPVTRTEYRVVGVQDGEEWSGPSYDTLDAVRSLRDRFRLFGDTGLRIQSRTVTESPWEDVEGER